MGRLFLQTSCKVGEQEVGEQELLLTHEKVSDSVNLSTYS